MRIACYNILPSRIHFEHEALALFPLTLLADKLQIASAMSKELNRKILFDTFDDDDIFTISLSCFRNNSDSVQVIELIKSHQKTVYKLMRKKQKDKVTLGIIGRYKKAMFELKKELKLWIDNRISYLKITELVNFDKEEGWELTLHLFEPESIHENPHIPILSQGIPNNEYILFFDAIVEELFTFSNFNTIESISSDFIKIPLWHFPMFDGITFNQMKYTLQDLKPALKPFNEQFDELSAQLFKMSFTDENQSTIKQMCREKLLPHIAPIQATINESLYISQLKNQSDGNSGMQFCLGIASAENLVNYFQKAEIIQPYVATETKEQLAKRIDLKAGCMFCYVKFIGN